MKSILIFLTVFLTQCPSKSVEQSIDGKNENVSDNIILNTKEVVKVGNSYEMKISKFISDSRCPEGVNCIWIGQVEMNITVFKGKNKVEEKLIVIGPSTFEENIKWFSKYIFANEKSITSFEVKPNRVKDIEIKESEYLLYVNLK